MYLNILIDNMMIFVFMLMLIFQRYPVILILYIYLFYLYHSYTLYEVFTFNTFNGVLKLP